MSDVEKFWNAAAPKLGDNRKWQQLSPMEQMQVMQGINLILQVMQ